PGRDLGDEAAELLRTAGTAARIDVYGVLRQHLLQDALAPDRVRLVPRLAVAVDQLLHGFSPARWAMQRSRTAQARAGSMPRARAQRSIAARWYARLSAGKSFAGTTRSSSRSWNGEAPGRPVKSW